MSGKKNFTPPVKVMQMTFDSTMFKNKIKYLVC